MLSAYPEGFARLRAILNGDHSVQPRHMRQASDPSKPPGRAKRRQRALFVRLGLQLREMAFEQVFFLSSLVQGRAIYNNLPAPPTPMRSHFPDLPSQRPSHSQYPFYRNLGPGPNPNHDAFQASTPAQPHPRHCGPLPPKLPLVAWRLPRAR
jgi:hypothetical protein